MMDYDPFDAGLLYDSVEGWSLVEKRKGKWQY